MKQFNAIVLVSIMALCGGTGAAQQPDSAQVRSDSAKVRLDSAEVRLQAVDVAAAKVERKADRFVVTVEGNPVAVGKSAFEMLSSLPTVWVDQNSVSINGQQGTTVIVDERMLQMSFDELKSYLSNIMAEDIKTIEVIPIAGAEYEAASSGGIIKITLKRQRNDGVEGSVSLKLAVDDRDGHEIFPAVNLNYKSGKLGLYSAFSFSSEGGTGNIHTIHTTYDDLPDVVNSRAIEGGKTLTGRAMVGAIYDLTEKHSLGLEYSWNGESDKWWVRSTSSLIRPADRTDNVSYYDKPGRSRNMSLTANYLWKIDKQGSLFKVIGSWTGRPGSSENNYHNSFATWSAADPANIISGDSLYRNTPTSRYDLYRLSADLDYKFNARHSIKTGVKYNYTLTTSSQNYSGFAEPETWVPLERFNFDRRYREHIAALYGIYTGQFGRVGLTAGLRGEYTLTKPRTTQTIEGLTSIYGTQKDYFNLFPNLNLSYNFDKDGNNSLAANYARTIIRPPFWAIDPFRWQQSEYVYSQGDPDLKPALADNVSLTFVYHKKYSLTAGAIISNNPIMPLFFSDSDDPAISVIRDSNMKSAVRWYISLSAPVMLTKWWDVELNVTGSHRTSTTDGYTRSKAFAFADATSTVTLPGKIMFETEAYVQSPWLFGMTEVGWRGGLDSSLKKNFLNGKLTAAVGVENILERAAISREMWRGSGFTSRQTEEPASFTVWGSVRWNFKAGKGAQTRRVDSSDDQSERMNGR